MNAEIKRHIDSARQVLVGVVPNPTSQIDQITNALIYKFMDDMDQGAIKAGGDPSFFVGDLEKYAWTRLIDTRTGNQEKMNLYSEALVKFSESEQLPELFRNIFKSAFLPYRSPEVLGLFLKEINYFDYSHPEDLGDAYEYLLSIMSSQGDAGQFRTPRHIIDFIVAVVNPTKDDKVLDPACGTAGFLISAYKHILKQHDGLDDPEKKERPLTPDDRKNLMNNFEGYDIDPGMVRIAQVNMYLHQFRNPKIVQYDSLSMDERWNDKFDVILANPPFMSPKGGIKPHSKFSVHSNRSEVLFVDYIMNHLRPRGRAGVIVPEGIIFQSGTTYKQLRKNLVNDGLYAVVSLPSGVFNPYAGVKTSILLFDNDFAKTVNEILFVKIENDGFDLGAQRRPNGKNDLPETLAVLKLWKTGRKSEFKTVSFVEKSKLAENGEYNLSGDRYKEVNQYLGSSELVELSEVCILQRGITYTKNDEVQSGGQIVLRANNINLDGSLNLKDVKQIKQEIILSEKQKLKKDDIYICLASGSKSHIGKVAFIEENMDCFFGGFMGVIRVDDKIKAKFLYYLLRDVSFNKYLNTTITGVNINNLSSSILLKYKIPLPSLEIQEQVVDELDAYQKIIDGAKLVVDNWKPQLKTNPEWETKRIEEVCDVKSGGTPSTAKSNFYENGKIPWLKSEVCKDEIVESAKTYITEEGLNNSSAKWIPEDSTLVALVGATIGKTALIKFRATTNQNIAALTPKNKNILDPNFLFLIMQTKYQDFLNLGGGFKMANLTFVKNLLIPLPNIEIQREIIVDVENERNVILSLKTLIDIYKTKISNRIREVWGE